MKIAVFLAIFGLMPVLAFAGYYPPWNEPPQGGIRLNVPEVDNMPDFGGDIVDPDLVIFYGGNEFMAIPKLIEQFEAMYPQYKKVYYETLPPGIIEQQFTKGSIVVGNLKIEIAPDVYTGGEKRIKQLQGQGLLENPTPYLKNKLAIMVYQGNPKKVNSLLDLGKPDVRVSMPGEQEDISKKILESYAKAGGDLLIKQVMDEGKKDGTTFITKIHHRETPMRIMADKSDAGPVWVTETLFQKSIGNPIDMVEIPESLNISSTSVAAKVKNAPHSQAADDYLAFLKTPQARAVFESYGFMPPDAAAEAKK